MPRHSTPEERLVFYVYSALPNLSQSDQRRWILIEDDWDDYSYRVRFELYLWERGTYTEIG